MPANRHSLLFIILAILCFVLAALLALGAVSGVATGAVAYIGLACFAAGHLPA